MTQQEKQLLLIDLCARLPYGVIVQYPNIFRPSEIIERRLEEISYSLIGINEYRININDDGVDIEYIKPYLRPIYSMTEEEKRKYIKLSVNAAICGDYQQVDYLNSIHVDYRGLIPKGLALKATEGMYNV